MLGSQLCLGLVGYELGPLDVSSCPAIFVVAVAVFAPSQQFFFSHNKSANNIFYHMTYQPTRAVATMSSMPYLAS